MSYHPVPTIQIFVGDDKVDVTSRTSRGVKIAGVAPQSELYQTLPDVKASADAVVKDTQGLKDALEAHMAAEAAAATARAKLGAAVVAWDGTFDVFVATAEKYCMNSDDGTKLALAVRDPKHNPLAPPTGIELKQDFKKDLLRIRVVRAPGMRMVSVEVGTGATPPTAWQALDGGGALHTIAHPAKGMWWVRAASLTARAKSDFTTPASILVI